MKLLKTALSLMRMKKWCGGIVVIGLALVLVSQLLGESKHPVVLHYYVSLPGEIMTEKPFIVQNTWTNEQGWGREERCPSHKSADIPKVDGLVVVRSMAENDLNASQSSSGVSANVSTEHIHISANFPFLEGNPFTATLWTGSEGFHMTVNGRHETSFPYREVNYEFMDIYKLI